MKKSILILLIVLLVIFVSNCKTLQIKVQKPAGFADMPYSDQYKAISPEGMLFKVKIVDNYPKQSLAFWSIALQNHFLNLGYTSLGEGEKFSANNRQGVFYEWGIPFNNQNYIYLTAIIVINDKIIVAESTAPHQVYNTHRSAIIKSLGKIALVSK